MLSRLVVKDFKLYMIFSTFSISVKMLQFIYGGKNQNRRINDSVALCSCYLLSVESLQLFSFEETVTILQSNMLD